jgi:hypothetical protein
MTVEELIAELQKCDPSRKVYLSGPVRDSDEGLIDVENEIMEVHVCKGRHIVEIIWEGIL